MECKLVYSATHADEQTNPTLRIQKRAVGIVLCLKDEADGVLLSESET